MWQGLANGSSTDRFVEQNQRTGSRTLMTVPTLGWVAKRRTDGHPFDCGFKVSRSKTAVHPTTGIPTAAMA